ncbi:hypothetical protein [Actinomadura nitritigenes]
MTGWTMWCPAEGEVAAVTRAKPISRIHSGHVHAWNFELKVIP